MPATKPVLYRTDFWNACILPYVYCSYQLFFWKILYYNLSYGCTIVIQKKDSCTTQVKETERDEKIILDRKIVISDALLFSRVIWLPVWFYNPPKNFSVKLGIIIQNENKTLKKLRISRRIAFPDLNCLVCNVVPMADHKEIWNTERGISSSTAKPDGAGSAQSLSALQENSIFIAE